MNEVAAGALIAASPRRAGSPLQLVPLAARRARLLPGGELLVGEVGRRPRAQMPREPAQERRGRRPPESGAADARPRAAWRTVDPAGDRAAATVDSGRMSRGMSRKHLLRWAGAAGGGLALGAAGYAQLEGDSASADSRVEPFHGTHQAGIVTPQPKYMWFGALDVRPGAHAPARADARSDRHRRSADGRPAAGRCGVRSRAADDHVRLRREHLRLPLRARRAAPGGSRRHAPLQGRQARGRPEPRRYRRAVLLGQPRGGHPGAAGDGRGRARSRHPALVAVRLHPRSAAGRAGRDAAQHRRLQGRHEQPPRRRRGQDALERVGEPGRRPRLDDERDISGRPQPEGARGELPDRAAARAAVRLRPVQGQRRAVRPDDRVRSR